MDLVAYSSGRLAPGSLRRRRRNRRLIGIAAALAGIGAAAGLAPREEARLTVAETAVPASPAAQAPLPRSVVAQAELGWMLAPLPTLGRDAAGFTREVLPEASRTVAALTPPAPETAPTVAALRAAVVPAAPAPGPLALAESP
ncbi:hypothetical protein HPY24_28290, partial [Methylobacterium sp. IIF1SW-B5]|nr:hypothetical protein [Methylobacterium ajmalii]